MSDFEFVKELPKRSHPTEYIDPERKKLADACRAHPGEWLKIPTSFYAHRVRGNTVFARTIKHGESPAFLPRGAFTAKVRQGIVYMKYLGEGEYE